VRKVHTPAAPLVARPRQGGRPVPRLGTGSCYHRHHVGDIARAYYRPKQEEQQWAADRDPIKILATSLLDQGLAKRESLDLIYSDLVKVMDAAVEFATNAPYPNPEEVDQDIYA